MVEAVSNALRSERMVLGESVFKFEEAFARYIGTKYAVSVSSGTAALALSLIAIGVNEREVITTPLSFIATANAIVQAGGIPTFSDVSESDYNMDPKQVRGHLTKKTKALLPVHLFGQPANMGELMEIAKSRGLKVIEDAAQAHGATFGGKKVGSLGDAGCFSFYSTKNMTVGGDGGMVTTDDEDIARSVSKLRDCGRISRYVHDVIGFTARLNTANAAFGLVQLRYLDEWNERRRAIAALYSRLLKGESQLALPPRGDKRIAPVYHLFAVKCQRRDELAKYLGAEGIECGVHYPLPIHLQPVYREMYAYAPGAFPISESLSSSLLSLPMFPALSDDEVKSICEHILGFYRGSSG
ncbi:MAG: DegT/DnrJ/EryC1/StrS family aminotransferase [Methanomassiliicoccales archaeon]|nr:DegT/DnrJ/EryC1/StrS family aminotransferase [Methanomassiliicoccales archaeon]